MPLWGVLALVSVYFVVERNFPNRAKRHRAHHCDLCHFPWVMKKTYVCICHSTSIASLVISFMYFSMYLLRAFCVFWADLGSWMPELIISVKALFCSV